VARGAAVEDPRLPVEVPSAGSAPWAPSEGAPTAPSPSREPHWSQNRATGPATAPHVRHRTGRTSLPPRPERPRWRVYPGWIS